MKKIDCAECNGKMEKAVVPRLFLNRYIVSEVTLYRCKQCGEELLEGKEYERVRKTIEQMEVKAKKPAIAKMLAQVKYLVL